MTTFRCGFVLLILMLAGSIAARAQDRFITLASTTSTEQSGLFGHVLPLFKQATGIDVRVVAVGSGQALAIAARGDADAVLVHDRAGEDRFLADGHGTDRRDVMFNDFVLVGPSTDPARVAGLKHTTDAFRQIAAVAAVFASRGDDSGTHRMERRLWQRAAVDVQDAVVARWYRELGNGMGATLNIAAGLDAYVLADRATWASFRNKQRLVIVLEGDPQLFNPYGSVLVNPAKGPHIKADDARTWHIWLTTQPGHAAITSFRIDGQQMFFPPIPTPRS